MKLRLLVLQSVRPFSGALGVTGSSGPGLALKSEAINLAMIAELPIVVCNIQRAGPSTGMPTKNRTVGSFANVLR